MKRNYLKVHAVAHLEATLHLVVGFKERLEDGTRTPNTGDDEAHNGQLEEAESEVAGSLGLRTKLEVGFEAVGLELDETSRDDLAQVKVNTPLGHLGAAVKGVNINVRQLSRDGDRVDDACDLGVSGVGDAGDGSDSSLGHALDLGGSSVDGAGGLVDSVADLAGSLVGTLINLTLKLVLGLVHLLANLGDGAGNRAGDHAGNLLELVGNGLEGRGVDLDITLREHNLTPGQALLASELEGKVGNVGKGEADRQTGKELVRPEGLVGDLPLEVELGIVDVGVRVLRDLVQYRAGVLRARGHALRHLNVRGNSLGSAYRTLDLGQLTLADLEVGVLADGVVFFGVAEANLYLVESMLK